jgi:UDP-N-acetylglucosamine 2-epimerase
MSGVFFQDLSLPVPDYQLGIGSGSHGEQTGKMVMEIEKVLLVEKPDLVIVYGDTNTTLAGALATAKLHVPLVHVEAGLRSFNRKMPEEINRVLTDRCSNILFCPTDTAVNNLRQEGFRNVINEGKLVDEDCVSPVAISDAPYEVLNVGDVMLDLALSTKKYLEERAHERELILNKYGLRPQCYALATVHRAENTDDKGKLHDIMEALTRITSDEIKVLFLMHPRTKKAIQEIGEQNPVHRKVIVREPVCYTEMTTLVNDAKLIVTDSGGLQKEAYFFHIPCVVLRDETEWTELVDVGWNKIAGTKVPDILEAVRLSLHEDFGQKEWIDFYGGGRAGRRIAEVLKNLG